MYLDQLAASVATIQQTILANTEARSLASVIQLEAAIKQGVVSYNRDVALCQTIWQAYQATPVTSRMAEMDYWFSELTCLIDAANAQLTR